MQSTRCPTLCNFYVLMWFDLIAVVVCSLYFMQIFYVCNVRRCICKVCTQGKIFSTFFAEKNQTWWKEKKRKEKMRREENGHLYATAVFIDSLYMLDAADIGTVLPKILQLISRFSLSYDMNYSMFILFFLIVKHLLLHFFQYKK